MDSTRIRDDGMPSTSLPHLRPRIGVDQAVRIAGPRDDFVDDLAVLFGPVIETAPSGSFYFAENGELSLKAVAETISQALHFGPALTSESIDV